FQPVSAIPYSWGFKYLSFVLSLLQKSLCVYRFEVLGPAQPVVAVAGEDVVLPCYIKPNISAVDLSIEWFRVHSEDPLVHLYRDHEDRNEKQIPSYSERTSLFPEELRNGNTSLKVKNVRGSDNGQYKCLVQSAEWYDDSYINVHIKAIGTQPMISIEGYKEGGISLVCESKGWYPQPQVVWMDSEGHKLPAGHTETYTDSMGLFIVRRRVIVQETKTNRFTCRVLQQGFSEVRETVTDVPGELKYFYLIVMTERGRGGAVGWTSFYSLVVPAIIILAVLIPHYMKQQREKVDVTLDPDTAHPELVLSENRKQVRHEDAKQDLPDNPERFKNRKSVLGIEGFSSGRRYWEVQVGDKTDWTLGVARESINRKEYFALNPNNGLWALRLGSGKYEALTDSPVLLHLSVKPQKVGVYVDYEEGQVSFYSVKDKSHIYTFTGYKFTEKLYPFFWPGFRNSDPLIISPVSHTD
uniref:Butyrophilin subfamily 1 member A1-like n=1 Tax=Scleropages formosus TaxID=113540 RepID=A0A8C9SN61_SCLFO